MTASSLLPAGFVARDDGRFRVLAPRLELDEMVALLAAARDGRTSGDKIASGRGSVHRVVLPGGKRVFVRKYMRGGAVRRLVNDLYLVRPERPFRELVVTETARAAGCPVPTVLAVAVQDVGPFYRGWIVTEAIENARPLIDEWLDERGFDKLELLSRVGAAIGSLHAAGVYHVDLTGHNVLIREGGVPVILDFDRGFFAQPGDERHGRTGLDRFWRSMLKLTGRSSRPVGPEHRGSLDRGYRA
jgi:3-deoxy-D-manno-octulosonic acid kinase